MPAKNEPILATTGKLGDRSQAIYSETAPAENLATDAVPDGFVLCTVTKAGHGKVSKGTISLSQEAINPRDPHAPLRPFPFHEKGDVVALPKEVADGLEDRGFVTT